MPVRFEKDPKTGKFRLVGELTAAERSRLQNQPPPVAKPKPAGAVKPPAKLGNASKPWWWYISPEGIGNELKFRGAQTAKFNQGQRLISGSAANPLMGGDPVYYDTRKDPKSPAAYSPGLRSTQQATAGVVAQAPANAALALVNLAQRLGSGQPLKPQKPENTAAGRAVLQLRDAVTRGVGAKTADQMTAEEKGFFYDLPASLATNVAVGVAAAPLLGSSVFAGLASRAPLLAPGAQQVLARGLQWGTAAAANEAASGILDDSTQGQAGDLLNAAGVPFMGAFTTTPEDDRISAGLKGVLPGIAFGEVLGVTLGVASRAADLAPSALRNLRERRVKAEVEGARRQAVTDGLQEQDPETGEFRFTQSATQPRPQQGAAANTPTPEVEGATGAAVTAAPAEVAAGPKRTFAQNRDELLGSSEQQQAAVSGAPEQAIDPVDGEEIFNPDTGEVADLPEPFDPALPELDAAAMAVNRLDDEQMQAVLGGEGPVLPQLEQALGQQQLPEPNPALSTRMTAAPTQSLADPIVGYRDQWETLPTADLQGLAHPDSSPDLYERVQGLTGRDWQEFSRLDVLDGMSALRDEGRTVIPSRLVQGQNLMPVEQIAVDPGRFQFKQNTNAQGQQKGNSLEGVDRWNPDAEGVVQVWTDPMDGLTYVVNGHNRVAKAKELGIPTLPTQELLAARPEQARAQGAISNISSGGGTVWDAAIFLRDSGVTDPARLQGLGIPLDSGFGTQGFALSRLPANLFQDAMDGRISLGKSLALGGSELSEVQMQAAAKVLAGSDMTDATFSEVLQQAKSAPVVEGTQVDLFGNTETLSLMKQKGELAAKIRGDLIGDKNLFGKVGRNAGKLQTAGNEINAQGSAQVAMDAQQLLAEFDQTKYAAETPISQLLNEGAAQIAAGAKVGVVAKRIKAQLVKAAQDMPAPAGAAVKAGQPKPGAETWAAWAPDKRAQRAEEARGLLLSGAKLKNRLAYEAEYKANGDLVSQYLDEMPGANSGKELPEDQFLAKYGADESQHPQLMHKGGATPKQLKDLEGHRWAEEYLQWYESQPLSTVDRQAMRAQILQKAIANGEVRPSASPLPPSPDAPAVDVPAAMRDLETQLKETGTIQPDTPAAQLLEEEARLAGEYSERDVAIAQELARAEREATGYWDKTPEERLEGIDTSSWQRPKGPEQGGLTSESVVSLEQQAAFARQQQQAALDAGDEKGAAAWREEGRRAERARILKAQQGMDASQQGLFGAGEFETDMPLLNGLGAAPAQPAAPAGEVAQTMTALTKGMLEGPRRQMFEAYKSNKVKLSGVDDPYLNGMQQLKAKGITANTQEEFNALLDRVIAERDRRQAAAPAIEIPEAASRKITAKTSEMRIEFAAKSLLEWVNSGVPGQKQAITSLDQALALVRTKGAILDPDAVPGLNVDLARNDRAMGRSTAVTEGVAAAYRQFYGLTESGPIARNGEAVVNSVDVGDVPPETIRTYEDLSSVQQARQVAEMRRALATHDIGLNLDGGLAYTRRKMEVNGAVDLDAWLGPETAKAMRQQFDSGELSAEAQGVRQALRDFYGLKPTGAERPLYIELGGDDAAINQTSDFLRQTVREIAGTDADVKLFDRYKYELVNDEWGGDGTRVGRTRGSYHLMRDLVTVNGLLEGTRRELVGTAYHEAYHRIQYGLLTQQEMKVLDGAFGMQRVNQYSQLSPKQVSTLERQAVAFQNYATARKLGGNAMREQMLEQLKGQLDPKWANRVVDVAMAFEKVLDFIDRIRNFAKGNGFETVDGIFDRIYSGDIAKERAFNSALELLTPDQTSRAKMLQRWSKDNKAPMQDIDSALSNLDAQIESLKAKALSGGC